VRGFHPAASALPLAAVLVALAAPLALSATGPSLRVPPPRPAAAPASSPAAATIGTRSISRVELDQRSAQALAEYRAHSGTEIPAEIRPTVKRQMLERLIQRELLALEARRQAIAATDEEAEAVVRKDPFFTEGGVFNEAKYLAVKNGNTAQFQNALEQARIGIASRRLTERVIGPGSLDERAIRAKAMRGLERASFEYLALRRSDVHGAVEEPREEEILAYYRSHAAEFRRPDRAVMSVLAVQQELGDAALRTPESLNAWEAGLRRRADSLIKVIQSGARLEEVAQTFGGLKTNVVALPGNFPPFWRGDERQSASVFEQRPGTVLPAIVPSNPGWLIVRVDQVERAHPARLIEASREIRARLRQDRREHTQERELRALYATRLDSLRGTAYRVRYATIDTAAMNAGAPTAADIDRFYRGHLADYSTFNSQTGSVDSQPLAEVRDNVRVRWVRERRLEMARALAERIADLWGRGKRDPALEGADRGVVVRDAGPVPLGVPIDSGVVAALVADSLAARGGALGIGSARTAGGTVVFHVLARVPDFTPTFDQARSSLTAWLAARQTRLDEEGARAMYQRDPAQFAAGKTLYWSNLLVEIPNFMTMSMTHREVEDYLHRHLDQFSAPEEMHASHILVVPADASPEADTHARARADSLLERLRQGENFAKLARQTSEDEATRDQGGDLGSFGRGVMLREFERAAFSLRPGEMSGLVKTEAGYHIIRCHDYLPTYVQPLTLMYSNVSAGLAMEKADLTASQRADSLFRVIRTSAQARAAAAKLHLEILPLSRSTVEGSGGNVELEAFVRKLETLAPGQLYPGIYRQKGTGYMLSWLDSITAPRAPSWETARATAIDRYRRGAATRTIEAKRAELDSMMSAGWSFDSLATLWGGLEQAVDANLSTKLPFLGPRDLDTLVFGTRAPARLKLGEASDWIVFPGGLVRMRVLERAEANATQVAARVESEHRLAEARLLAGYFEQLKKRFPVRILDPEMRAVELPPIPEESSP
jgi:parvulin-like peptidyl-prolyl isomerase